MKKTISRYTWVTKISKRPPRVHNEYPISNSLLGGKGHSIYRVVGFRGLGKIIDIEWVANTVDQSLEFKPNYTIDWLSNKPTFMYQLKKVEAKVTRVGHYRGSFTCPYCNRELYAHTLSYQDWVWPAYHGHLVSEHFLKPHPTFYQFIVNGS
jgi:hypothetical protein